MFHPLELFIGLRYTRAKRRNHFISFISIISILGIALGVATLITVISVMNGFERELRDRILGMASHATINPLTDAMTDWPALVEQASQHPEVVGAAPYIEGEVMMNNGRRVSGSLIRGVIPEMERMVSEVAEKMVIGDFDDLLPGEYGIILGRELALMLGVTAGDKFTVITPQANSTPVGIMPRMRRFTVVGIFEVGMFEYDRTLAFMHIEDAGKLLRLEEGGVSGVRLKLQDMFTARRVASELASGLNDNYWISDWTRRHSNYFKAVQTEKKVMFVILTLILTVAAFNIVSTLIMVVTDKQSDIAILRTLGISPGSIMKIFIVQGTLIGVFGAAIGMLGGVLLATNVEAIVSFLESIFQTKFLAPDIYYISELPSHMRWSDVGTIGGVSFLLSILATLYPAWRASQVQPAEALRYE
jgi:lipoprotein-releasing system permease protein